MILTFGAGDIIVVPTQDAFGSAIANPTPVRVGGGQEFTLDFAGEMKEYYGQGRYSLAIAQGKVKTMGKIKGALLNGAMLNSVFFGFGLTTGTMKVVYGDTSGTPVPTTPFTITPTPPSAGTWVQDLGVQNASGITMTRVASAPITGQYSVAAGVYTFAAADVGITMYISYDYTYTLATGKKISLQNLPMGYIPTFELHYSAQFLGKRTYVKLFNVTAPKLQMFATKNDDFSIPSIDYGAQADSTGFNIGELYVSE